MRKRMYIHICMTGSLCCTAEIDRTCKSTIKKFKNPLELINEFSKVTGYKINIQKYVAFLYANNKISKRVKKKTLKLHQGNSRRDSAIMNMTSIHEDGGSIPSLTQWVKGSSVAMSCGLHEQLQLQFDP